MKRIMAFIIFLILLAFSVAWGISTVSERMAEKIFREDKKQKEMIDKHFKEIQRKHGDVMVSTDFSHFIRLNGEKCRLKPWEKPPMYR